MPISRRTVLRGAGALLALPWLEALAPLGALARAPAGRPPLRLGIFSVTGGTVLESWAPKEAGPLTKLPSILRPLEFARDDLLVISGLSQSGRSENLNAHEHCACTHLTGAPLVKREGGKLFAGVSVDQAAARVVGDETFLPSLEMGRNSNQYSFRGREVVVPYEQNPRLIFDRMFRGRKPVVPNWARRTAAPAEKGRQDPTDSLDQSVIDLVLDQAKELRRELGRGDQQKLDTYLDSVRSVEKRIAFVEARRRQEVRDLASPGPSKPLAPGNLPADGNAFWKMVRLMDHDPEAHGEYIRLLADLMILAFQTDTTRVVTVAAGSDDCMFPGVVTVGYERHCHTLEHQGNAGNPEDADPISREALRQVHAWYTGLFAEMIRKMKAIDEGGTSLLDNSLILYTSYMADGGHGRDHYPVLLAGRAGGTLRTGRHLVFPKKAPVANLYVEMLDRMGVPTETFGDSQTSRFAGSYGGRLPGLS
jgi:hypothetical protein